ncbi:Holliday junction resolvase RuvX [Nakamurella silvestris]|nr:Holliday junction resolvase RuvX [Nakamurella silvestris]
MTPRAGGADGSTQVPRGVRLGVDVGSVRVGVAISDPSGILATPVGTLARDVSGGKDLAELAAMVAERSVVEVVIGLPRSMSGKAGAAVQIAREYGNALQARIEGVPIVYVDERLTSVTANRVLAERGVNSRNRRAIVDQVAAVEILQARLETVGRVVSS